MIFYNTAILTSVTTYTKEASIVFLFFFLNIFLLVCTRLWNIAAYDNNYITNFPLVRDPPVMLQKYSIDYFG